MSFRTWRDLAGGQEAWILVWTLTLARCMTFGKSLFLSGQLSLSLYAELLRDEGRPGLLLFLRLLDMVLKR